MQSLPNKTFHLVYHDIGSQHNAFTKWINSMVTPQDFAQHLDQLCEIGDICTLEESFSENTSKRPRFVIWFDDAYSGVSKYGSKICEEKKVAATLAVNSEFALHKKCFWRCELSWILENYTAIEIADRIFDSPYYSPQEIWHRTLQQYTPNLHHKISEMFRSKSSITEFNAWQETFMNDHQIRECINRGWTVCNHTANHPAFISSNGLDSLVDDFNQGSSYIRSLDGNEETWVIPFDYGPIKQSVDSCLSQLQGQCKHLVRAFYFPQKTQGLIPRITMTGEKDVLGQINRAIAPQSRSVLRHMKSLISRIAK